MSDRGRYRGTSSLAVVLPIAIFAGLAITIWGPVGGIIGLGAAIGIGYFFGERKP